MSSVGFAAVLGLNTVQLQAVSTTAINMTNPKRKRRVSYCQRLLLADQSLNYEDVKATDAKTELEAYMFYYHRYESHRNAMV